MARLQILELPEGDGDDRPPFVLVVDETVPQRAVLSSDTSWRDPWQDIADKIGARGVIVTPETVDIPGNDVPLDPDGHPIKFRIEPDFETFREQVQEEVLHAQGKVTRALNATDWEDELARLRQDRDEARSWARHGYEIGQKHCGWTDHGVAPAWLTEGWPNSFDSCEHLKQAAELEKAEDIRKRVAKECKTALLDALGMDRTRDWDDIRNAARGIRKQRDEQATAIERVRQLHKPVLHRGEEICWACSAYDFVGQTTDNSPVAYNQCGTLQALNGEQEQS